MTLNLQHKILISTRAENCSEELKKLFNSIEANLIEFPLIQTIPVELTNKEQVLFHKLENFNWIIFTSVNAVEYFFNLFQDKIPAATKIAAIGKKTANSLTQRKVDVDFINTTKNSILFAQELKKLWKNSKPSVLWPTSKIAPSWLIEKLHNSCKFTRLNIYDTILPEIIDNKIKLQIIAGNYDLIYFFSSSAVHNFVQVFKSDLNLKNVKCACIGEITANTCLTYNIKPLLVASSPSSEILFNESLTLFKN